MSSPVKMVKNRIAVMKTLYGFVDLVKHPEHLERVFEISDALVQQRLEVLGKMRDAFARTATGAVALREKHRVALDLRALDVLPVGTLGRAFADHMRANGLDPAAIPTLEGDDELLFVRAHLYETHDIWHAVTGFDTDVAGALGLQAFYWAQLPGGLPATILGLGFFNTLIYAMNERDARMRAIVRGWLLGKRAKPFFGVRWNEMWGVPVTEVRRRLGVDIVEVEASLPGASLARAA